MKVEVGKWNGNGNGLAFASVKTYAQSCDAFNFPPPEVRLRALSILGPERCRSSSVGVMLF